MAIRSFLFNRVLATVTQAASSTVAGMPTSIITFAPSTALLYLSWPTTMHLSSPTKVRILSMKPPVRSPIDWDVASWETTPILTSSAGSVALFLIISYNFSAARPPAT